MMYDSALAELRLFGAGPIIPAEAELFSFGLDGVAEQILNGAEEPGQLSESFAEFSAEMIVAAEGLAEASHEIPLIEGGEYTAEATTMALLKVGKASNVLLSATKSAFPHPTRVQFSENMTTHSETMYQALAGEFPTTPKMPGTNNAELIHSSEQLMANAELYTGASEMFSSTQEFVPSCAEFADTVGNLDDLIGLAENLGQAAKTAETLGIPAAIAEFASTHQTAEELNISTGSDYLLAATQSIALSAELYSGGGGIFQNGEVIYGAAEEISAEAWVPAAETLLFAAERYTNIAQGQAAVNGAETMVSGAAELYAEAEYTVANLTPAEVMDGPTLEAGSETLVFGAEQYVGAAVNYQGAVRYGFGATQYWIGAEAFAGGNVGAEKLINTGTIQAEHGGVDYNLGAEVLTAINTPQGVISVYPAAEAYLQGAEKLFAVAVGAEAEQGAELMLVGSELMLQGAELAVLGGAELAEGSAEVEDGSGELYQGAAEFITAEVK